MKQGRNPTYTERQIKDQHVGVEMFLVFAVISSREVGCRGTPSLRIDGIIAGQDIEGSKRQPWPEPNLDAIFFATCESIESTPDRV